MALGQYASSVAGCPSWQYINMQSIAFGTKVKARVGYNASGYDSTTDTFSYHQSYRNITVYTNKIVIGSGFYDNYVDHTYGALRILMIQ